MKKTIKSQLIDFVKSHNRPVTRKEICNEYKRITGKTSNLALALCFGLNNGIGGYYNACTEGYLCRNTGYGRIKAIARNQYIVVED